MRGRALVISLLLIATAFVIMSHMNQRASAQTLLANDIPLLEGAPVPDEYDFEVLGTSHAVVGVRSLTGDDFDIEVYEDTTFTTMIESSTTVGDAVDFVVLDKTTWASPPNRAARVTSGSTSYIIEMENDVDDYTIIDSWSGSMDTFPGNPVLDVGPPGSWDDAYVAHPSVLYDGTTYHMWYGGLGANVRIGYATSPDGITWTKYAGNPVLNPGPNPWDSVQVHYPMVLYNGTGFEMWYSGYDGTNYRVGYATSPDGISWTKYAANPVLNLGLPGSWEDFYVGETSVLKEGGIYHMWYSGVDSSGYSRTGYATSPDGITWTKYSGNPVLDIGPPSSWDDYRAAIPEVINVGSRYHMWYTGNDGTNYRIGYATSFDKVNWTKSPANPVLDLGPPGSWEDVHVHSPTVLYDGTTYHMWYSGSDGLNLRIGYATSTDKDNWTKVAANPVLDLGPPGSWDDDHVYGATVLFDGTTYHMWYHGFDGLNPRIGYATSPDSIIWTKSGSNPVLDIGPPGSWDDNSVSHPTVLYDGATYHLWYSAADGSKIRIGYANSSDGLTWTKYAGNPVLDVGPPGSWEDNILHCPMVLYDGATYHMWYQGHDDSNYRIGYATSLDRITWTKYAGNPVLDLGPLGSWEDTHVLEPMVLYDGTTYYMWYGAGDGSNSRIGFATSSDGIIWTKNPANPVLDLGPPGSWDDFFVSGPTVLYDGATYHMWYEGHDGANYRVGYANLTDDFNWSKFAFAEVLDAYEITNITAGFPYTITLDVPSTVDLDLFIFNVTGGRDDAVASSTNIGAGINESISFVAPTTGDYLLVITNEDGGIGTYNLSFIDYPPTITDITAVPDPQEVFYAVNVSANITDNYQLFGAWVEIYDPDGGLVGNLSMKYDQVNGRYYWNQTYNLLGTYTFTIRANDTSDNWASASDTFIIQDTNPPIIADVTAVPDPQEVFYAVNVSANITDNYQLFGAWVEIYDPDGSLVGNLSMKYDPVNGRYYWDQIYNLLGTYIFTIWANDTRDNWASDSSSFVIQDTRPPTITDVTAVPDPQEVFYAVNISAIITDNYKLFGAWVEIYDPEGISVGNFPLFYFPVNGRYYWTQTYDLLGTYTFTIRANDTSNNWASVSDTFVIQDTTPPLIADVTAVPNPQEVFDVVNISANITDNYQLFGAWVEIYDPNGISVGNFPLFYDQVNGRYYWNQTYNLLGTYTFTIRANDTSDNWASASDTFVIQDTTPPMITNIATVPDPQKVFGAVNISANVTDNYQLYGVWVEIHDLDGNFIGNFSMSYDTDNGRHYWNQTYDIVGIHNFTISANDTSDNWASALGSFIIQPTLPPTISDVTAEPVPQIVREKVTISAIVTDEDTDLDYLTVSVNITKPDGTPLGNFTMTYNSTTGNYSYTSSFDMKGNYTFVIWANDPEGNWATENGTFVMEPKSEPREFNWKPIIALIFAIILLILGILVAYYRPVRFTGILERDRWYTFIGGVLPFVIAEVITGIVSFFTGLLSVPPILGVGLIVDLIILIAGIISCIVIYKKGTTLDTYEEEKQPPPPSAPPMPPQPQAAPQSNATTEIPPPPPDTSSQPPPPPQAPYSSREPPYESIKWCIQ